VNFRKAFDSIFHFVLMQKLQNLCISSDLWSWINDYLTDCSKFTVINRQESQYRKVKFGVLQGSVLGRSRFVFFIL
jgi:Na+/H+ antiporter NhaA